MQIHVLCMPIMDQMSTPLVSYVMGGQRTVIRNIEISETWRGQVHVSNTMRVECIIFYLDPKSVGLLIFLGKKRVHFLITDEYSFLAVFTRKFAKFARLKAEAEKHGLGFCVEPVELKFCPLRKGKDGSKAFAINAQER